MCSCRPWLFSIVLLLTPVVQVVHADTIYQWIDPQGRVHYGSNPPPDARQVRGLDSSKSSAEVNIVSGVGDPMASTAPTRGRRRPETDAARRLRKLEEQEPTSLGGMREGQWRSRARSLEQKVESLESQLEHAEDQLSSAYALGRAAIYQRRVNRLERKLEAARDAFERFEERARELGVPPGWLR